jgi:hypothetical protein
MTFEEDGETFSTYFLLPRTREGELAGLAQNEEPGGIGRET